MTGGLYAALALVFCAPLFRLPHGVGVGDWDQHLFYYASVLNNVVEYGAAPFWNPWYCGGNVLWANPQVALLSPVYPIALVTSLPLAMKVTIVLHYVVGLVGMHLLLRRVIGLRSLVVVVYLASVFTLSGAHALHLAVGHSTFLPAFLFPLQLFWVLRAIEHGRLKYVFGAAALLALMIYGGGMHVVPMALTGIGGFSAFAAVLQRSRRPLVLVTVLVAAGLAYAGPKLVPVTLFVGGNQFFDTRGGMDRSDFMTPEMLVHAYITPYQDLTPAFDDQRHGWHEYGNFTGALFGLLFMASLVWVGTARRAPDRRLGQSFGGTAVLLLFFSAGEFAPVAPASLARLLPFFSSYRIPSRFTIVFVLFAVMTVAWVWRQLAAQIDPRQSRGFVAVVCVLATAELVIWNGSWFRDVFSQPPLASTFAWGAGPRTLAYEVNADPFSGQSPMLRALMNDRSFVDCYEPLQLDRTSNSERPLVWTDGRATIFDTWFSPNEVSFSVLGSDRPATVVLNTNYAPGWRSTLGPIRFDETQPGPSAMMPADQGGRHAFTYVPEGLWVGLGALAVALAGSVWGWRRTLPASKRGTSRSPIITRGDLT